MTKQEIQDKIASMEKEGVAEYKRLKKLEKYDLLRMVTERQRVNSLSLKDSKDTLINALLQVTVYSGLQRLERDLRNMA